MGIGIGFGLGPLRFYAPLIRGGRRRRGGSGGGGGGGIAALVFLVLVFLGLIVRYWYIGIPLAVIVGVGIYYAYRNQEEARERRKRMEEAREAAAVREIRERLSTLRGALGGNYEAFALGAYTAVTLQQVSLDRIRQVLGVGPSDAKRVMHLLEQERIVTIPNGGHRQVLVPARYAHLFKETLV